MALSLGLPVLIFIIFKLLYIKSGDICHEPIIFRVNG
jgi:hypothetical protein